MVMTFDVSSYTASGLSPAMEGCVKIPQMQRELLIFLSAPTRTWAVIAQQG